jgi:hypothetical protein
MRMLQLFVALVVLSLAGSAQAVVKFYSSDPDNGTPGNTSRISINLCPPAISTPDQIGGFIELDDGGSGTVTLSNVVYCCAGSGLTDLSGGILIPIFGPGAFIFIDAATTTTISAPGVSNTSGVGAHGPSGTDPGESIEWGVIGGWEITGAQFCLSSPVTICNENGFAHGATVFPIVPSTTYNLGTWDFTAVGDIDAVTQYLTRTSNGGLSNNGNRIQSALHGSSIPALPLVGFAALALSLTAIGGRALLGKK